MSLLLAAALAAAAAGLAVGPGTSGTTRRQGSRGGAHPAESSRGAWVPGSVAQGHGAAAGSQGHRGAAGPSHQGHPPSRETAGASARGLVAASASAGVAAGVLIGGWTGVAVGLGVALLARGVLGRLEPASARRRRLEVIRAAPIVSDLLAASLGAGVPLEQAVPVIARALGGDVGQALQRVHRRVELGEPSDLAWAELADVPGLGVIARAVARSARTGAPLARVLSTASAELRAAATAAAMAQVRATAVRAVLPLGLCLLPAFVLLGIVPVVGGLLPTP